MARIKIDNLPESMKVSKQEMSAVMGGQDKDHKNWSDFMSVIGPGGCPYPRPLVGQEPIPDPEPDGQVLGGRGARDVGGLPLPLF